MHKTANDITHDVIINGAGPVGSALALALAKKTSPRRIAIIGSVDDNSSKDFTNNHILPDPRTLALNHGSRVFLESISAWTKCSADIKTVHVSQSHRLGRTLINNHDLNVPRLGSVVNYDDLISCLHNKVKASNIDIINETDNEIKFCGNHVELTNRQTTIRSAIAIQSTGIKPKGLSVNYKQDGLLFTVKASNPKDGWAFERFTKYGPLALLPHPMGQEYYAVVWCSPPKMTDDLINLDNDDFNKKIQEFFGNRLGTLSVIGERSRFPLNLHVGSNLINCRTVAIGNAAQTIHPVAGQGLNLGLRDVAQLSISLTPWFANKSLDIPSILSSFTKKRSPDRWLTIGITNALPQIFNTKISMIEHLCGISLTKLDLVPPLRNQLTKNLLQGLRV